VLTRVGCFDYAAWFICPAGKNADSSRSSADPGAPSLLAMFNAPQLEEVAQEVEDTIVKIMKEAASD
jgi:hypothetical protein